MSVFHKLIKALLPPSRASNGLVVHINGQAISLLIVRRAGMKRMTLRLRLSDGAFVLTAPPRVARLALQSFAERHTSWIAARLQTQAQAISLAPQQQIALRGQPHRLVHIERVRGGVQLERGEDGAAEIRVTCAHSHFERRLRQFLHKEAAKDLQEAVQRHASTLGVSVARIVVRDQSSRWGSCSVRGVLSFSWRLILTPPFVLNYLAAHEVAHVQEMNHSPQFWQLVARLDPHHKQAEKWLKDNGQALQLIGRARPAA